MRDQETWVYHMALTWDPQKNFQEIYHFQCHKDFPATVDTNGDFSVFDSNKAISEI